MKKILALALLLLASLFIGSASGAEKRPAAVAKDACLNVLQNNATFSIKESNLPGKQTLLQDYLNDNGYPHTITQFTVWDMDGNGVPELLLELSPTLARLVLRYEKGVVYGYEVPYRGMRSIKTDGTFDGSNGASSTYISKLRFLADGGWEYIEIAGPVIDDFDKWDAQKDVPWHPYSADTFAAKLAAAWPGDFPK